MIASMLKVLGLSPGEVAEEPDVDTAGVRQIMRALERVPPDRARYLAAFAYVLGRGAYADGQIGARESRRMHEIIQRKGHLSTDDAQLVVDIALSHGRLFGATDDFLITRQFRQMATREQCLELLSCLFAVTVADDAMSSVEEEKAWQVAKELGLAHSEYVAARAAHSDKRSVLRSFRRRRQT